MKKDTGTVRFQSIPLFYGEKDVMEGRCTKDQKGQPKLDSLGRQKRKTIKHNDR